MGQMLWAYVEYEWTEWTGLRGGSLLNCQNEFYREIGGLYLYCRVLRCAFYGWERVNWEWG